MFDLIIKNGKVVSPSSTVECDVAVKDGKIAALGHFNASEAASVVDATGKYVMPGVIEAHMHCQAPFQGCLGANTFFEQSISGAFGGVTTFMDFANMGRGQSPYTQALARAEEMSESAIDYSVHGKFVESTPEAISDIEKMANAGIPTFKMFMTYKKEGVMSDDETMLKVFQKAKEVGGLPMVHCESNAIAETNIEKCRQAGDMNWVNFAKCKPVLCEAEAFARAVYFAEYVGNGLIVVHTTNGEALGTARRAQAKDIPLYVETGPHYLTLFDDLYEGENGHLAICSPPLRTPEEAENLWKGLEDGTILLTGSDDCTFDVDEKSMFLEKNPDGSWKQDFTKVVNGLSGLEIRLPILLSEGVNKGRISINKLCALTSTNIAKVYGCYPHKGIIAPGSDADIVLVDLNKEVVLSKEVLHNNISYCLHEGMKVTGFPVMTISKGKIIVENGEFKGEKGAGRFLKRKIDPHYLEHYSLD
ncbi:dihydropyrimidinase [Desulforamulus reducens MI-1]|uniref:Dihydropyrimidinase n=1 Tax=Desulforamulus reducens (strain ATCC BAA-1160 / DSM 100696 / MI-1) TaxID=349161 RepID=A4J157_DESRM|nr:dihydropyrimidinase [Desulforamulus reducens]ABO48810.1 dihydropyrimidinase [Desulforamulus reducens MI-1]